MIEYPKTKVNSIMKFYLRSLEKISQAQPIAFLCGEQNKFFSKKCLTKEKRCAILISGLAKWIYSGTGIKRTC
jgi:hypothetical protein